MGHAFSKLRSVGAGGSITKASLHSSAARYWFFVHEPWPLAQGDSLHRALRIRHLAFIPAEGKFIAVAVQMGF